ncbi:MAG: PepSY-like domain-containing protein [Muribaculaceae bacterium]|nr:PepSY-like domain-containing protein [Muribaculaceae bacterium]
MKKSYIKILSSLFLLAFFIPLVSCSDDDQNEVETTITVKDLPADAQSFLKKYFPDYEIVKITKDVEDNITLYEVDLQDGYEVVFNGNGEWTQVEAPYGKTIPTGFIPEQVMSTLNDRFPYYGINEINTTGQGYKVELSDNQGGASLDIFFDMSGEIIGIDELD